MSFYCNLGQLVYLFKQNFEYVLIEIKSVNILLPKYRNKENVTDVGKQQ